MALFRYRAISVEGRALKGVIDADSLLSAKERLRKQQVLVTSVAELKTEGKEITLPPPLLLTFTRELGQLLHAGLPLYESLLTIEEKYRHHRAHPLFLDLCDHLKEGHPLSSALRRYPKTFYDIYLSMVETAEHTGNLHSVFGQLYLLIARQQQLKKQLVSTLTYPALLAAFCFCVLCGLLFFVVPSMSELFEGRTLHPLTALVVQTSNWASSHLSFLVVTFGVMVALVCYGVTNPKMKRLFFGFCLQAPLLKTLLLYSSLARLSRSFSLLLAGGLPLLDSLRLSKTTVKNPFLEEGLLHAERAIMQGEKLSNSLKQSAAIPPLVIRMVALAEETGNMEQAFSNLAGIYEEEVEKSLSQLTTLLQPALLITLGAIVGFVVLSILLPLTDVGSFISN